MIHAPFWKRLGASVIDGFFCYLVLLLIWGIWINAGAPLISLGLLYIAIFVAYSTVFLCFARGKTPGLGLFKISVISEDGTPPSFTQAFTRSFVLIIGVGICLLGLAAAFIDEQRRALHDLASFTKVVALL